MSYRKSPDHGELLNFTVQPTGDVLTTVSNPDDRYAIEVLIKYSELAGMAEAAKVQREIAEQAEAAKLRTVDYFYGHGAAS